MDTKMTTVLLADDHEIVREGLRAMLQAQEDIEVVGEAENGRQIIKMTRQKNPDLVIMDIAMPDLNGIDATMALKEEFPDIRVIALSMHSDKRFVLGMLKAGASGYLLKECAFQELITAVRSVLSGGAYISPKIAGHVLSDYVQKSADKAASGIETLSGREREVLQLIAEGKSTKEIASSLNISVKTVETRRKGLMDKLGVKTIADLVKFAIREGMISYHM